jgi:hypothetical protein
LASPAAGELGDAVQQDEDAEYEPQDQLACVVSRGMVHYALLIFFIVARGPLRIDAGSHRR